MMLLLIHKHGMWQLHWLMNSATSKRKWLNFSSNLKTPLHIALMLNHGEFVLLFLQNGTFFNAKNQEKINPIEEVLIRTQITILKNNNCVYSILRSKDWLNDGLVATPTHVLCTVWLKSQTGCPILHCKRPNWRVGVWPT